MNYKILLFSIFAVVATAGMVFKNPFSEKKGKVPSSFYDVRMKLIDGKDFDFSTLKGRKVLLVNTASKCGKTPQYAGLEKLHESMGDKVVVLGFPANNFLWQEPGSNQEIAQFCERNYGVSFRMFEKISVKGSDQHPLYQWLESKTGERPDWNFAKYLVNEDGTQVTYFKSGVQPMDEQLVAKISGN